MAIEEAAPEQAGAPQDVFVSSWQAYDKILKNDYLSHLVLYSALAKRLSGFAGAEKFALLDLGCGDAHYITDALRQSGAGRSLGRYTGVDLAADALKLAMVNVAAVADAGCQLDPRNEGIVDFGNSGPESTFDVALTSFAAHHLSTAEKQVMLHGVYRHLRPGGVFYVCDAFRLPGESRAQYMDRFCAWAAATWTALTPPEFKLIEDHMRSFDYPEPVPGYEEMARNAGFGPTENIVTDKSGNFKVLAFVKPA